MTSKKVWVAFCSLIFILTISESLELQEEQKKHGHDENVVETSNSHTNNDWYQASDVIDLIDLEAVLSRASSYKVISFRGSPQLKVNGTFVETNEGIRKLLTFINNAKLFAGNHGFSSRSSFESEGLVTTQLQHVEHNGVVKRDNRYEISYWNYKHQGPEPHEVLEKYEVKVVCQPSPPGHTVAVNGHSITQSTAVWELTVTEACRFWKS